MIKVFGLQHPHDKVVELFNRYGGHGKLLDAPSGPGVISQKLKEAGFDVVAIDINAHLFCVQGFPCEKADLNFDLPFSNGTFDYILCSNGIEHLENPVHFIRESFRILKEGGKLLISTPNILNLKSRLANLLVGFNLFTGRPNNEVDDYLGGDHIHLANYYELRTHLHRNGFRRTAGIAYPLIGEEGHRSSCTCSFELLCLHENLHIVNIICDTLPPWSGRFKRRCRSSVVLPVLHCIIEQFIIALFDFRKRLIGIRRHRLTIHRFKISNMIQ